MLNHDQNQNSGSNIRKIMTKGLTCPKCGHKTVGASVNEEDVARFETQMALTICSRCGTVLLYYKGKLTQALNEHFFKYFHCKSEDDIRMMITAIAAKTAETYKQMKKDAQLN